MESCKHKTSNSTTNGKLKMKNETNRQERTKNTASGESNICLPAVAKSVQLHSHQHGQHTAFLL